MKADKQNREGRFLELVEANRPKILRICRVYAWSASDQEDLRQEMLLQIWRGLPSLKEPAHANTWLYRTALNTAISFVRRQGARRDRVVQVGQEHWSRLLDQQPAGQEQPSEQLLALYEAITRLNEVEKAVITLFLEGLTYEESGEVMGLRPGNVGVMLHRVKAKLATMMEVRHER